MGTLKGGYIIPASPLPEDDYCLKVYIPANTEYLIQFFTALGYFGKWNSWKRLYDGSNLEKQVADRWKVSIEKTHDAWSEGGCEMFQLRQSSTDPCILEQSIDGGTTWTTAFDYSLCLNNITVPAPYPGSETGASDAAAAAIRNVFEHLVAMVDCGAGRDAYIVSATAYLRTFDASYASPAALGAIFDAYCADPDAGDAYSTDCPYTDHKSDLQSCANSDGLFDWLNCLSDTLIDWLNTASDDLMNALNQAAAALSGNGWQNAAGGGAGGGAGFGGECGWSHTWDSTNGWTGWYHRDSDEGALVGNEWTANGQVRIVVRSPLASRTFQPYHLEIEYSGTDWGGFTQGGIATINGGTAGNFDGSGAWSPYQAVTTGSHLVIGATLDPADSRPSTQVELNVWLGTDLVIHRCTISGNDGADPFA